MFKFSQKKTGDRDADEIKVVMRGGQIVPTRVAFVESKHGLKDYFNAILGYLKFHFCVCF